VRDPYDLLGVSRAASDDEIHAAYRTLAKRYHPDLHPNDPTAEARFKEIAAAYALLSHPEQRARHERDHPAADANADRYANAYAAGRGYRTASADAFVPPIRRARQRGALSGLLIAFGLWTLLSYGNGLLRGFTTALDGTIESRGSIAVPLVHYLFFGGGSESNRRTNLYTIRDPSGSAQTFIAGPPCSLLHQRPRTGGYIHKEAWQWTYEIDGRRVSDFSIPVATSCALGAPLRLLFGLGPLLLGFFWRTAR
jgi:curved DNA-binding protein CbpA